MKVIITGASGFIGARIARHCIKDSRIDHAFILTRKALPTELTESAKVTVITHEDFSSYPDELLKQLAGAEGCLWAIGGRASQFPDVATARRVQVDYPTAALRAFAMRFVQPLAAEGKKFRFVFVSGQWAEWDQEKSLAFMSDTRKIKGAVEKGLCDIADENKDSIEVYVGRPSGVLPADAGLLMKTVGRLYAAIGVDVLASALTNVLVDGYKERIIENDVLLKLG